MAEKTNEIKILREGSKFWHMDCTNHFGGIMREIRREPEKSLFECGSCRKMGYYPVGAAGAVCVPEHTLVESAPKEVRGVGLLVVRNAKILLGLRTGAHGADTWAPPGGKEDEEYESPVKIADRELGQETGLKAYAYKQGPIMTTYFEELHQVHRSMFIEAAVPTTEEPKLMEPDKCKEWRWFDWDDLPPNLFPPFKQLVEMGYRPRGIPKKAA